MGAALGSIMPTIITAHMAKVSAKVAAVQRGAIGIAMPAMSGMPRPSCSR